MCACARCKKELTLDLHKSGILCKCLKGYYVIGTKKCSECGKELEYDDWKRKYDMIDKFDKQNVEGRNKEIACDFEGALQCYLKAWDISLILFHKYNVKNIPLLENIVWSLIKLGKFREAHKYCRDLLDITKESLPYFTSHSAITEYKLAKIEYSMGYIESALKYMIHAYQYLKLTHVDYPEFLSILHDTIDQLSYDLKKEP